MKLLGKTAGVLVILLLVSAATAFAAPAVAGLSGEINTPDVSGLKGGGFSLGLHSVQPGAAVGAANFGLTDRLEVGMSFWSGDRTSGQSYLNAKYNLVPETVLTPGLSIGGYALNNGDARNFFVVAGKSLPLGFRVNAGLNGRDGSLFASLEKTLNPLGITGKNMFPATTLVAEFDGHDFNYGLRMAAAPGLRFDAGCRSRHAYFGATFTYN